MYVSAHYQIDKLFPFVIKDRPVNSFDYEETDQKIIVLTDHISGVGFGSRTLDKISFELIFSSI